MYNAFSHQLCQYKGSGKWQDFFGMEWLDHIAKETVILLQDGKIASICMVLIYQQQSVKCL